MSWFFIPLITFMFFNDHDMRFSYILIPIYVVSCGFSLLKIKNMKSKYKGFIILIIFSLLLGQIFLNTQTYYKKFKYPVEDIVKSIENDGNVLILSETPVYSSAFIFYSRIHNVPGNIIRPCILLKENLDENTLRKWGVRYIIDQDDENELQGLNLKLIDGEESENYDFKLFETTIEEKVECNYICRLDGKLCKEDGFSGLINLIKS